VVGLLIGSLGASVAVAARCAVATAGLAVAVDFAGAASQRVEGLADIWQLDVGQGLAILMRTRHHAAALTPVPFRRFRSGERVVLPALRKLGVNAST
jgi:competence protein ComEC